MTRIWIFLYGRILRTSLIFTAFLLAFLIGSSISLGKTDLKSLIDLFPFSAWVLFCPGTGLGFFLFMKYSYREIPFYWNRGFTLKATVRLLILSSISLFSISFLLYLWVKEIP